MYVCIYIYITWVLPWWLRSKESACNSGDWGLIPGSGRYLGEGNGNPLQYSRLENSVVRGTSTAAHGESPWTRKELDTTEALTL